MGEEGGGHSARQENKKSPLPKGNGLNGLATNTKTISGMEFRKPRRYYSKPPERFVRDLFGTALGPYQPWEPWFTGKKAPGNFVFGFNFLSAAGLSLRVRSLVHAVSALFLAALAPLA